ncbi:PorT family protein [Flavobacterium sp. LS1R49]|uniref:PorT family protein n=1 Tax=Flavobacterium shii TaxID=2987687 RepID=A0A9X2ZK78_9FLAO|nr:porin family protein [Flavobacterium shii]MCV9930276.1 PorT family protein [Flavobacterium shii]
MKKLFLLCIILISTTSAFSQSFFDRLHFGLKAGANYSDFNNANFETEGLVGFHAGAIVAFDINKSFSIQEEFLFSTQGAKLKGALSNEKDLKLSYISVPIVLKYKTKFGLYIEAGPQFGILASENFKAITSDKFGEKIDAGVVGGIGYQLPNGLGIGARYYMGLTDVSKIKSTTINTDFQNNTAQVSLFYIF